MGLPQLVHVTRINVAAFSAMIIPLGDGSVNARLTYIFYVYNERLLRNFKSPFLGNGFIFNSVPLANGEQQA